LSSQLLVFNHAMLSITCETLMQRMLPRSEQPKADLVNQFLSADNMSAAERQKLALQRVGAEFQRAKGDTGSTEVQGGCTVFSP